MNDGPAKRMQCAVAAALMLASSGAVDAEAGAPPGGTVAYVLTDLHWAVYASPDGKTECPTGINEGNREQFQKLFPKDGTKRTLIDTQLRREIDGWYPTTAPEPFLFHEAEGPTSYGLNLDGQVGPNDFTSPDGEAGVDNQLYRAIGCINGFRVPDSLPVGADTGGVRDFVYNRIVIRLTGVESLVNDEDVDVTIYRGRDPVRLDAAGQNALPGGSQRIDTRWGSKYIRHLHGKIVEGVLTTEPADWIYPFAIVMIADQYMYGARFKLKLTATGAEGIIGGYSDVESWYFQLLRQWGTRFLSYGQLSAPSIYKALRRLADGYPNPQTGVNTAISSALQAKFTSVMIVPSSIPGDSVATSQHPKGPFAGPPIPRSASEEDYRNIQRAAIAGGIK